MSYCVHRARDNSLLYNSQLNCIRKKPLLNQIVLTTQLFVRNKKITIDIADALREEAQELIEKMSSSPATRNLIANLFRLSPTLENHITCVCILATAFGQEWFCKDKLLELAEGAIYHDIGKIRTPHSIICKTDPLTKAEQTTLREHAVDGRRELAILELVGAPVYSTSAIVALEHHERFDGSGYPYGKKGCSSHDTANGIHIYSQVVAMADMASMLMMQKHINKKLTMERVVAILDMMSFEPFLYGAFRTMLLKSE